MSSADTYKVSDHNVQLLSFGEQQPAESRQTYVAKVKVVACDFRTNTACPTCGSYVSPTWAKDYTHWCESCRKGVSEPRQVSIASVRLVEASCMFEGEQRPFTGVAYGGVARALTNLSQGEDFSNQIFLVEVSMRVRGQNVELVLLALQVVGEL